MPYSRHSRHSGRPGSPAPPDYSGLRYWAAVVAGILVALLVVFAVLVVVANAAQAADVSIPDSVFRGDPGDVFHAGTIPATAGDECAAQVTYTNNEGQSEHPDTDILVGPVTFPDVEHGAFMSAGLTFIATGNVDVALRLGSDGVSSGGYLVEVTCNPPTTTTTTTTTPSPTTTSTTVPSSTTTSTSVVVTVPPTTIPPVTTTTEPPPINGIDTGGGACADGGCDSRNWLLLAGVGIGVFAGLAAATAKAGR